MARIDSLAVDEVTPGDFFVGADETGSTKRFAATDVTTAAETALLEQISPNVVPVKGEDGRLVDSFLENQLEYTQVASGCTLLNITDVTSGLWNQISLSNLGYVPAVGDRWEIFNEKTESVEEENKHVDHVLAYDPNTNIVTLRTGISTRVATIYLGGSIGIQPIPTPLNLIVDLITSGGIILNGDALAINLGDYYTKSEVDLGFLGIQDQAVSAGTVATFTDQGELATLDIADLNLGTFASLDVLDLSDTTKLSGKIPSGYIDNFALSDVHTSVSLASFILAHDNNLNPLHQGDTVITLGDNVDDPEGTFIYIADNSPTGLDPNDFTLLTTPTSGVTSVTAGNGVTLSSATGDVTITADFGAVPTFDQNTTGNAATADLALRANNVVWSGVENVPANIADGVVTNSTNSDNILVEDYAGVADSTGTSADSQLKIRVIDFNHTIGTGAGEFDPAGYITFQRKEV